MGFGSADVFDQLAWWFNFIFMNDKFRGLFSLMFGASMLLVVERSRASGSNPAVIHFSRMLWLGIFGIFHFLLLWSNDILQLYALCGMILFAVCFLPRTVIWLLAAATFLYAFLPPAYETLNDWGRHIGWFGVPETVEAVQVRNEVLRPESEVIAGWVASQQVSFAQMVEAHLQVGALAGVQLFKSYGAETLSLMLVGMALLKNGFLTGQWEKRKYLRWALALGVPAILGNFALALWQMDEGFPGYMLSVAQTSWSMPFDFMLTVAYAALLVFAYLQIGQRPSVLRVAAAGRMAFTNYIMTSVIMTPLFYGFGLGLVGQLEQARLFLIFIAMSALMLIWSKPWLDRFYYGPFEWLWRSLARGEWQRLRKKVPSAATS